MSSDDDTSRVFLLGRSRSEWISCTGPCMLTFSIPLLIPGIALTVISLENETFDESRAFFSLGVVILAIAVVLFTIGFIMCLFKNIKIPPTVGVNVSSVSLRDSMRRIYIGNTSDIFQANRPANGAAGSSQTTNNNINSKNYKNQNRNYNLNNGMYTKHGRPSLNKQNTCHSINEVQEYKRRKSEVDSRSNSNKNDNSIRIGSHKIPVIRTFGATSSDTQTYSDVTSHDTHHSSALDSTTQLSTDASDTQSSLTRDTHSPDLLDPNVSRDTESTYLSCDVNSRLVNISRDTPSTCNTPSTDRPPENIIRTVTIPHDVQSTDFSDANSNVVTTNNVTHETPSVSTSCDTNTTNMTRDTHMSQDTQITDTDISLDAQNLQISASCIASLESTALDNNEQYPSYDNSQSDLRSTITSPSVDYEITRALSPKLPPILKKDFVHPQPQGTKQKVVYNSNPCQRVGTFS